MPNVVACIDGSGATSAVCDYAAWASARMGLPLTLLHVLDGKRFPAEASLAGNIGLGTREHLLTELAELDEQRNRLALRHGRVLLEEAEQRLANAGTPGLEKKQRHGSLLESLEDLEDTTSLFVMGLHGEHSGEGKHLIGSQLETVIRRIRRPIVLVPDTFTPPRSAMLAFDGSQTAFKSAKLLATTSVFEDMPIHIVMVGPATEDRKALMAEAEDILKPLGGEIITAIRAGEVEEVLGEYKQQNKIDLMAMGAYGHSKLRRFLVGSTTTHMLEASKKPVVILR